MIILSLRGQLCLAGSIRDVLSPFLAYIKFHMIPASVLMTEIHPLGLVPYK